jgi:hypothetical protein
VGKVLQPLESQDPYADDYYFLQLNIKKNMQAREQALKNHAPPPPLLQVPLPTWKETKERIKVQLQSTRESFEQKTREWEEKEQVLGHRMRAEISKPREQLALPSLQDLDFDINDDDGTILCYYYYFFFENFLFVDFIIFVRIGMESSIHFKIMDNSFGCTTRIRSIIHHSSTCSTNPFFIKVLRTDFFCHFLIKLGIAIYDGKSCNFH